MHDDLTLPLGDSPSPAPGMPEARDAWGPFRLLARVGSGGFGEVYRAWDPNLEREVALKLLLPGAVGGDEEYTAMLREARAMASVQHPNIVHVYGIDRHDGRVGFWTDFVKGKTLSALLGTQGPFGYREAALIGIDVSRALAAVHRAGLLHRDIKAENVMREEGGRILLMDFGLSAGERSLGTQMAGTPNYMAPEIFEGGKATVCTDIYAVGVLLYYLVVGDYPARLTGLTVTEAKAALTRRTPLVDLRSDLPEGFLRTVRIAMELDPSRRFASAGELAESLAASMDTGASPASARSWSTNTWTPAPAVPMAPPPPPPAPVERTWKNAFGMVEWFTGLPKKTRWAVLGVTIFLVQKGWRSSTAGANISNAKTSISAPMPPDPPDSRDSTDQYLKAEDLLQRPYKDSNVEEAVKGFKEIPDSDPKFALAQAGLGSAYFTQYRTSHDPKLLDMAKKATADALKVDPNLAPAYVTLARMEAAQGNTELALKQAQKALQLDPRNAEAHGTLAQVYEAQGRTKEAIQAVQKAIDLAPDKALWQLRLGGYYFNSGDIKNAADRWKESVDLDNQNPLAYFDLGMLNINTDDLEEASSNLQQAIKVQPTSAAYGALGEVLMLQGKYDEAVEMNQKAVKLSPNDYAAWGSLASSYEWSNGGHEKAMQTYAKAIELAEAERAKTPNNALLLAQLGDYYASSGQKDLSLVRVRKALALSPEDPTIQYFAGETYELLGQRSEAIPLVVKALTQGYHANEFRHSPELKSLRSDLAFQTALATAKARSKNSLDKNGKLN